MALQNWYKAVVDYSYATAIGGATGQVLIGHARNINEVVRRLEEKFTYEDYDSYKIRSIEYLGWDRF